MDYTVPRADTFDSCMRAAASGRHDNLSKNTPMLKHNLTAVRVLALAALVAANLTAHAALGGLPLTGSDAHVRSAARLAPVLAATPNPSAATPAQAAYTVGPAKPPPPLWEKDTANFVPVENSQKLK
jgi:hypothetical protein